jgi:hypothetical protein
VFARVIASPRVRPSSGRGLVRCRFARDTADAEALLSTLLAAARLTRYHRESREHEVAASSFDDDCAGEITVSRARDGYVCFTVKIPHEHALRYAELLGHHTPPETNAVSAAAHRKGGQ